MTTITSSTYPAANYSFTYVPLGLVSPFTGQAFSSELSLRTVTNSNSQQMETFTVNNSGEMTDVQFPYGGHLGWAYTNMTYTTGALSRTLREIQNRYLTMSSGGTQLTYAISHDPGDSGRTFHYSTVLDDAGGQGEKAWFFQTDSAQPGFGLQNDYSERQRTPSLVEKRNTGSTWANERVLGRPYISSSFTTLDPGTPNQAQSRTDQLVDQYGNVTSLSQYDFGLPTAPSTASRVYSNTYLSDSSPTTVHPAASDYNNEHIHNRLLTTIVTQPSNGQSATLVSNKYDFYDPGTCGASRTPSGWQWNGYATSIDPNNTSNVFRGNVTTSYGLDMEHDMCYAATGAVVMSTDGGHVRTTQTDYTTNYTAPTALTTGSLTTSLSYTGFLAPASQTGPNGDGTSVVYDAAARPSKTYSPYGAYTTFTYGTSAPFQNTAVVTSTDPHTNGRKTVTKMDGLGRAIEVDAYDAGGTLQSVVQTQYDACGCSPLGKMTQTSRPYKPGDPIYWTVYSYDGLGRTTSTKAPDGASTTTYSYAGNTVTVTDPAGNAKTFTMDAFGNLTKVVEQDLSQTLTANQATTNYVYDALNHLTSVSMPRQMPGNNTVTQTRTFNYLVGSTITAYLRSAANPENGTVSYTYNADGTLATKQDAKGQTLKYAYDSYGRVLTVSLAGSPDTVLRTYTYDTNAVDPNYSQYASGRLTTVQYSVPSTTSVTDRFGHQVTFIGDTVTEMYSYTRPGQIAGKELQVARQPSSGAALTATLSATWSHAYNEGNLTGVSYPGDPNGVPAPPSYNYTYDGMGRLYSMTDGNGATIVSGATYNAAGQMLSGVDVRTYNSMGQLTSIVSRNLAEHHLYLSERGAEQR